MPTDNPKISLYVPQQIYDRFKEFQSEQDLSMSQAGIVILAEYFGLKETIKEITEGTTVGGVTLTRIEELEKRLKELEEKVSQVNINTKLPKEKKDLIVVEQNKTTDESLKIKNHNIDKLTQPQSKQLTITGQKENSKIIIDADLLKQRLNLSNSGSISNKRRDFYKQDKETADLEFSQWTKEKDIDGIAWKAIREGKRKYKYVPYSNLSEELHSKLLNWMSDIQIVRNLDI